MAFLIENEFLTSYCRSFVRHFLHTPNSDIRSLSTTRSLQPFFHTFLPSKCPSSFNCQIHLHVVDNLHCLLPALINLSPGRAGLRFLDPQVEIARKISTILYLLKVPNLKFLLNFE